MPSAPVKKLRQEKIKCSKIVLVFVRGVDGRTPKRIPTLQSGQNSSRIPLGFFKNSVRMAKRIPILQSGQNSSRILSVVLIEFLEQTASTNKKKEGQRRRRHGCTAQLLSDFYPETWHMLFAPLSVLSDLMRIELNSQYFWKWTNANHMKIFGQATTTSKL